tara:strand:+ start:50 stop:472 length:423 start_codon:yes stop_codon:yes gene_type:complete
MKKLLLVLLFVPLVSFGQTKIGYGNQKSTYDVTVKDNLNPLNDKKYKVEVESRRDVKPNIPDTSPLFELSDNLMERARELDAAEDARARSLGWSSAAEMHSEIRNRRKQAKIKKKAQKKYYKLQKRRLKTLKKHKERYGE